MTLRNRHGYSLFEMILVIIIVGILATVTMRSLNSANNAVRFEETRAELDRLATAITGNPDLTSGGSRADYGYLGDIGALPPNLEALVNNPGLSTWNGPYLRDNLHASAAASDNAVLIDAWGKPYTLNGVAITSTGGSETLTRLIAPGADHLLYNRLTVRITDLALAPPGSTYRDSVRLLLTLPDGSGGLATRTRLPNANGLALFDSLPIGSHLLSLVYLPGADTLRRRVPLEPGAHVHIDFQYPEEVW